MSLWVDKYKPTTIDQLTYHKGLSRQLKGLVHLRLTPHATTSNSYMSTGSIRQLAPFIVLWSFRCWQKDTYCSYASRIVWSRCRKGKANKRIPCMDTDTFSYSSKSINGSFLRRATVSLSLLLCKVTIIWKSIQGNDES